jgi:hypothetical protein
MMPRSKAPTSPGSRKKSAKKPIKPHDTSASFSIDDAIKNAAQTGEEGNGENIKRTSKAENSHWNKVIRAAQADARRTSQSEDIITTDLSFEHMLSFLFGQKRFHGRSGHLSPRVWRGQILEIFKTLEKAVRETLNGDDRHRQEIEKHCQRAIADLRRARSTGQISVTAIEHLTYIVFLVIGEWPNNWEKGIRDAPHPKNWNLTRYRTLQYLRSDEQKIQQIISLTEKPEFSKLLPSRNDLWNQLHQRCKGNARQFIAWFKIEYRDIYLELE